MPHPSLQEQYESLAAASEHAPRCRPTCARKDWVDIRQQDGKTTRTICGRCGTFIGYRPNDPKQKPKFTTESTEDTDG